MYIYTYISRGPGKSSKDSENSFNSRTSDYKRNKFGTFLHMYITQLILLYIFPPLSLSLPPSIHSLTCTLCIYTVAGECSVGLTGEVVTSCPPMLNLTQT